jgi:predicted kinase
LPPEAYAPEANTATNDSLAEQARVAARSGHATIIDATFLDAQVRQAIVPSGRRFLGIWLHAPLDVLEQRIAARTGDASDATVAVMRKSAQNDPGPGDWLLVDATDASHALDSVRSAVAAIQDPPEPPGTKAETRRSSA